MKFTKRPITIEALKFIDTPDQLAKLSEFIGRDITVDYENSTGRTISIDTLEGVMTATEGDWIIKGVKGEFYPCKPDIFEATYDLEHPGQKSLDVTSVADAAAGKVNDIKVVGNGDTFQLLCKASSESQGWMKSAKAMQLPKGCLVQVTTQQGSNVAEALCYVPDVRISDDNNNGRKLVSVLSPF